MSSTQKCEIEENMEAEDGQDKVENLEENENNVEDNVMEEDLNKIEELIRMEDPEIDDLIKMENSEIVNLTNDEIVEENDITDEVENDGLLNSSNTNLEISEANTLKSSQENCKSHDDNETETNSIVQDIKETSVDVNNTANNTNLNEIEADNNEVKVKNNEIEADNNEVKVKNNEIEADNNEVKVKNNEIKNDEEEDIEITRILDELSNEKDQEDSENDKEFMKVFKSKIKLSDGTEEYIFSSGVRYSRLLPIGIFYSKSYFPINCHLCKTCKIRGKYTLYSHVKSSEHIRLLEGPPPDADEYRKPYIQPYGIKGIVSPIKIYPGENIKKVTPEYYDRVRPTKECLFRPQPSSKLIKALADDPIQDYNQNAPVLGLCYAFKLKPTVYYCALCRTDIHGEGYQHFVGAAHQSDYITKHFKNLLSQIAEKLEAAIDNHLVRRRATRDIFRVLYRKIEMVRGLRKVSFIDYEDFRKHQKKLINACCNSLIQYHYDENTIEFHENEIQDLINKVIKGKHVINADPNSIRKESSVSKRNKRNLTPPKSSLTHSSRLPPLMSTNSKSLEVVETSRRHKERKRTRDLSENEHLSNEWDRYRRMVGATLDDLDKKYERYELDPQSHPRYQKEWQKFWRTTTTKLERDHINPNRYDYKSEWETQWPYILRQCHEHDVKRRKRQIKNSLKLPLDARSPSPIRKKSKKQKFIEKERLSPRSKALSLFSSAVAKELRNSRMRSRSPLSSSSTRYHLHQYHSSPERSLDYEYEHRLHEKLEYHHHREKSPLLTRTFRNTVSGGNSGAISESTSSRGLKKDPLNVISILRLLSALEYELGSLGPKVVELLGKAILIEKDNQNPNELLKIQENYILFTTSMEKLKGQLYSNIVSTHKINAVENAVNDLETIINEFDKYKQKNQVIFGSINEDKKLFSSSNYGKERQLSPRQMQSSYYDDKNLVERVSYRDTNQFNSELSRSRSSVDGGNKRYESKYGIISMSSSPSSSRGFDDNQFNKDPRIRRRATETVAHSSSNLFGSGNDLGGQGGRMDYNRYTKQQNEIKIQPLIPPAINSSNSMDPRGMAQWHKTVDNYGNNSSELELSRERNDYMLNYNEDFMANYNSYNSNNSSSGNGRRMNVIDKDEFDILSIPKSYRSNY